jgi:hypothetical protein
MTTQLIREAMNLISKINVDPVNFHWFDVATLLTETIEIQQKSIKENKPPFPQCMVCWEGKTKNNEKMRAFLSTKGQDPEDGILLTTFRIPDNQKYITVNTFWYFVRDGLVQYAPFTKDETVTKADANMIFGFLAGWYECLSRRSEVYIPSVKQTFSNRRKIAKGKVPTYEWRTVTIEPTKPRQESQGGTHASPRLHDRRGHLRKLASGKTVWVKNCKVGDANKGIIFHDYKIAEAA